MNPKISELLQRIRLLESEIEQEIRQRRAELHADFEDRRIRFEREVLEQQRRFRMGMLTYVREAELRNVITAPVIYSVILPLLLLELLVYIYQLLCFPLCRIPRVCRRELKGPRADLARIEDSVAAPVAGGDR